jgi:transketolase
MRITYVSDRSLTAIRSWQVGKVERAAVFADVCRLNTLSMIMEAGSGHIGSSFSAMDIVVWLHLNEMSLPSSGTQGDIYFSSKGHDVPGLYAVQIGLGLLSWDNVRRLRRLGGLPGHPDVSTPYCAANTGSLGMGVSKAKGMVRAARLVGQKRRVFVMTGDGELQEGQFWESLPGAAIEKMDEITAFVDHNKMQSDTWVEKVSSLGDLQAKLASFGWEVRRCDGHDFGELSAALAELNGLSGRPKVVIADTVKGKGVRAMENVSLGEDELYRFHSGAPATEVYEQALQELRSRIELRLHEAGAPPLETVSFDLPDRSLPTGQRLVRAYAVALVEQARRRDDLVVLDADLMLDCGLIPFREKFPDRFIECGIAEQDMVSQAGALALQGKLPIAHSFACFLSTRPNEQIYNNATERTKLIYVGSLAGLLPAGPGHSHQSVRDIGALAAVPGLTLLEPCNETETAQALDYCVNQATGCCYLRLVSVPYEVPFELPPDYRLTYGRGVTLRVGDATVMIGYGPILLAEAWKAAEKLSAGGVSAEVVNLPWLNYVDDAWLRELAKRHHVIFTLDNHYVAGGQGQLLATRLAELPIAHRPLVVRIGVNSIPACGQNAEVLRAHGLDAGSLATRISQALGSAR